MPRWCATLVFTNDSHFLPTISQPDLEQQATKISKFPQYPGTLQHLLSLWNFPPTCLKPGFSNSSLGRLSAVQFMLEGQAKARVLMALSK
jgi:hypothetical protein